MPAGLHAAGHRPGAATGGWCHDLLQQRHDLTKRGHVNLCEHHAVSTATNGGSWVLIVAVSTTRANQSKQW